MPYAIVILRRTRKELAELPLEAYPRLRDAIRNAGRLDGGSFGTMNDKNREKRA